MAPAGGIPIRTLLSFLCFALLLLPGARAEEDRSDCEGGQPWILPDRQGVQPVFDAVEAAAGVDAALCEGEQWDGQDAVSDEPASCTGTLELREPYLVGLCLGADPNGMSGEDPANPLGVRASTDGANEAYAAVNLVLVGRVAIYGGTCAAGDSGLEGEAACRGGREARAGVYWRDNTPGNIIVQLTPRCLFSITGCYGGENDCDYALYRYEQESGQRICGRDNTALGLGLVLP